MADAQRFLPSSHGTYGTGFRRLVERFGERPVDAVTTTDIDQLALFAVRAVGHVDGRGAVRNLVHASRYFYGLAHQHGFRRDNPASAVALPNRHRRVRRGLSGTELVELYDVMVGAGDDPLLDLLLLEFHRETPARRGGGCALRLCDLRPNRPSVFLREKGGHEREVPASPDLLGRIGRLAVHRGAGSPEEVALRYKSNPGQSDDATEREHLDGNAKRAAQRGGNGEPTEVGVLYRRCACE